MVESDNTAWILSFLQLKYYVASYCTAAVSIILLPHNPGEKTGLIIVLYVELGLKSLLQWRFVLVT